MFATEVTEQLSSTRNGDPYVPSQRDALLCEEELRSGRATGGISCSLQVDRMPLWLWGLICVFSSRVCPNADRGNTT